MFSSQLRLLGCRNRHRLYNAGSHRTVDINEAHLCDLTKTCRPALLDEIWSFQGTYWCPGMKRAPDPQQQFPVRNGYEKAMTTVPVWHWQIIRHHLDELERFSLSSMKTVAEFRRMFRCMIGANGRVYRHGSSDNLHGAIPGASQRKHKTTRSEKQPATVSLNHSSPMSSGVPWYK